MGKLCRNKTRICCSCCGCYGYCCCCCKDSEKKYSFTFQKVDRHTNEGLSGAVYVIKKGPAEIAMSTSKQNGEITFSDMELGEYTLSEVTAPEGYAKDPGTYSVIIHQDGVLINDVEPEYFIINNCKIGDKVNLIYHANEEGFYGESLSLKAESGKAHSIMPNIFFSIQNDFVEWNTDPWGKGHSYQPEDNVIMGCDFMLYAIWKSMAPTVNPIYVTSNYISGSGIANSKIDVHFPMLRFKSTVVDANGCWQIQVPKEYLPLLSDTDIIVYQTEFNMYQSEATIITVRKQ